MKTIASAIIGLSFAVAGFAQTAAPAPAAKADTTAAAPAKAKKAKKHNKKVAGVTAEKPAASTTPAMK